MTISSYLTIPPNWIDPVTINHAWHTSIQTSIPGQEKRSALFTWHRKTISYTLDLLTIQESNWMKRHIFRDIHNLWGVPLWPDYTYVTASAAAGQKIIAVEDTDDRRFATGDDIVLINPSDFTSYEKGTIDAFTATQITLVDNLVSTWPTHTDIYPLMTARMMQMQEVQSYTAAYGSIKITAKEVYE